MSKMNYIMISPHFPSNFETFVVRLNEKGITTLGIADEPYDNLSQAMKDNLTEYYRVDDMEDYDQMYRAVAYFASKYGKIDRIESHNEHWLMLDAQLRTDFNVFGYNNQNINLIKFKSTMKEVFREIDIPVAKGRVVTDYEDAKKLAKRLAYPVIMKPDIGVGANDTFKIHNDDELAACFEGKNLEVRFIMEEFIDGDIVTFDGLTDRFGNIVFSSTLYNDKPILDIVSQDTDMYYHIPREIDADLQEYGERCIKAFDIRERFFHIEFFRLKNGELYGLEINCRPPGGITIDMFNYANEIDIFSEYANVVKDNEFKAELTRPYHCIYISRKNHIPYIHTQEDVKSKYGDELVMVTQIPGVFAQAMGDVGFILRTPSEELVEEIIQFISERNQG